MAAGSSFTASGYLTTIYDCTWHHPLHVTARIAAAHDLVSAYHYPVISDCCIELIFGLSVVIVTHRSHHRTIDKVIILLLFGLVLLIFHMFSRRRDGDSPDFVGTTYTGR